jgi:hypothetical protein
MDTARLFLSESLRVDGAADSTSAEGESNKKPNQKVVGGGVC